MIKWHRIFGAVLCDLFDGSSYTVELEKELSLKQQFLDVVIIQQTQFQIILPARLPDGLDNLREHNLLTYKSHQESLNRDAIFELYGHFINYCKQAADQQIAVNFDNCQLYAVTARMPEKLFSQGQFRQVAKGVYDYEVLKCTTRILVTSAMDNAAHNAIWQLFSGNELQFTQGVRYYGVNNLSCSELMRQLFRYYQQEELFPMAYSFEQFKKDLHEETLRTLTERERIQAMQMLPMEKRLEGIPTEKRLEGISIKQRLEGISTKQRLEGVSTEQRLEGISAEQLMAHVPVEQRLAGLNAEEVKKLLAELNKKYS